MALPAARKPHAGDSQCGMVLDREDGVNVASVFDLQVDGMSIDADPALVRGSHNQHMLIVGDVGCLRIDARDG